MTLSIPLSAWAAFAAIHRLVPSRLGAWVGGLLYGFSPYMMVHATAHLNMVMVWTPPLVLLLLHELLVRRALPSAVTGAALGLLLAAQMYTAAEVALTTAIVGAGGLAVLALVAWPGRAALRLAGRALLGAGAVALVLGGVLAAPLVLSMWLGSGRLASVALQTPDTYVTDLLGLVMPTGRQLIAPGWQLGTSLTGDPSEWASYVGVGLLALLAWRFGPWAPAGFVERRMLVRGDIPAALAVGPDGAIWFTIENSNAIGVLRGGKLQRIQKGRENLEPLGLAVAPDGHVWFTDAMAESIGHLAPDGAVESIRLPTGIAQFGRLAVAPDGAVWFAEGWTNSVVRLKDGVFTPYQPSSPNASPFGVALDAGGTVWATLQAANRLVRITPDGQLAEFELPTRAGGPSDVAVDPSGAVWFIELRAGKIGRFADGRFSEFPVPAPSAGLTDLAVAPDGSVWFTELREHKLGRLRDGSVTEFRLREDARPFGVDVDAQGNVWYTDLAGWLGTLPAEYARSPGLDLRRILPWPRG
jgi:virginiamycin B lyase